MVKKVNRELRPLVKSCRASKTVDKIIKDNNINIGDLLEEAVLNYESKSAEIKRGFERKKERI